MKAKISFIVATPWVWFRLRKVSCVLHTTLLVKGRIDKRQYEGPSHYET
jgi:hypothetical protein